MQDFNDNQEIDFDELARLARENPDGFEATRKRMIQEVIDNASPEIKHRMEGLQWQIDQVRKTSSNPMASCLKISEMMWDSVLGEDGLLESMQQLNEPQSLASRTPRESAKIIDINKPKID